MNEIQTVGTGGTSKQEFGGTSLTQVGVESASTAVAAQMKATVEARYIMALQRPRDWDQVRQELLRECRRPTFARNKSAYYKKPIGDGIEGLGIRFTEVALRCMKNVLVETNMIFEDSAKEIHRVTVTDLENNITYPMDVNVTKTVERSKPSNDGHFFSVRKNSYNKFVYTVAATDDDMLNKRASLISKAQRTLALRIIPGDLQDEAIAAIKHVRLDDAAKDPDAERKGIIDAFGALRIKATDLVRYLGHSIDTCSPAELVDLRAVYSAVKDGETTWASIMEERSGEDGVEGKVEARPEVTAYPADKFTSNLPTWQGLIEAGKKTAEQIIATASSKHKLTDEQVAAIKAAAKPKATEQPSITYAQVANMFNKATTLDALDEAADLVGQVKDEQQRKELREIYEAAAEKYQS